VGEPSGSSLRQYLLIKKSIGEREEEQTLTREEEGHSRRKGITHRESHHLRTNERKSGKLLNKPKVRVPFITNARGRSRRGL